MPQWLTTRVVSRRVWTPGLFTLGVDGSAVTPFEPGQFLHLGLHQSDELVNRPYSIASPPGAILEFFIVTVPGGKLTPALEELQVGDPLVVSEKAAGSFTLNKTPIARDLWLIGTGTGIAPYLAMLRSSSVWERYERIVLCHGVRYLRDLGYEQQLVEMMNSQPHRFRYIPTVTREQDPYTLCGRLTNLLESGQLEHRAGFPITADTSAIMLCGNPDMLDEMEARLIDRGLRRHRAKHPGQIVVERYW